MTILLTGATGYVGGRLLRAFEKRGTPVRCLVRRSTALDGHKASTTELVLGNLESAAPLTEAFKGVETAYYLVHSLGTQKNFEELEQKTARHFADACLKAGVKKIIYLGGLSDAGSASLSDHLRSRNAVGDTLRDVGIPVIEFKASIIIGSGSVSYELIRALVERLPVMVTPRWVSTQAQPIGIEDVVSYLVAALDFPATGHRTFEIGGPSPMSYRDLMNAYARERGLRRWMIRVPVLTPRLSSLWLGLVTPLYARVGRKLVDGMRVPSVVRNPEALSAFPIRPRSVTEALKRAFKNEDEKFAATRWYSAVSSSGNPREWGGTRFGNRLVDSRTRVSDAAPERAFETIEGLGGAQGWYYGNFLWRLRGWLDLLVGGAGLRRGRSHPSRLRVGDPLDFWRVDVYDPPNKIRLAAEMKLPGRAWLEFVVAPLSDGRSRITQTAIYDPLGLGGLLYWYVLFPIHQLIFAGMLKGIALAAAKAGDHLTT